MYDILQSYDSQKKIILNKNDFRKKLIFER